MPSHERHSERHDLGWVLHIDQQISTCRHTSCNKTCLGYWHVHEGVYTCHPANKLVRVEKHVWDAHVGCRPEGFADQLQQLGNNLGL